MRVKIQQFLFGKGHSWSHVGKETARALIQAGHEVELFSTDGLVEDFIDKDLKPFIKYEPSGKYDLQFSYTAMKNFPVFLNPQWGGKRFGMWTYEFDVLPEGYAKYATTVDKFLIPSNWFKDVCIQNKIEEDKLVIVPHGVDWEKFDQAQPMKLKTNKKIKILVNFAQPHLRKNIYGTLEAFGKAFNKKDDVCLVLKVKDKKPDKDFEVSFSDLFNRFKSKFPNHAECLVLKDYIPNIESLYKSCDVLFMLPHAEGFFLPALEALAADQVVITSNYGGQLDFLNNENSFLINGKEERADKKAFYWTSSPYAKWFVPDTNEAAEKLKYVCDNLNTVKQNIQKPDDKFKEYFSWNNVAKMLEEIRGN